MVEIEYIRDWSLNTESFSIKYTALHSQIYIGFKLAFLVGWWRNWLWGWEIKSLATDKNARWSTALNETFQFFDNRKTRKRRLKLPNMREIKCLLSSLLVFSADCQEQNASFAVTGCNVDPNIASVSSYISPKTFCLRISFCRKADGILWRSSSSLTVLGIV